MTAPLPRPDFQLIERADDARTLFAHLLTEGKPIGIDIETGYDGEFRPDAQKHPEEGFIVSVQVTNSTLWGRMLPLRFDGGGNLDNFEIAKGLWPLAQAGLLTAWNASFEGRFMSRWFKEYLSDHPEFGPQVQAAHYGNPEFCGYFPWRSDPMLEAHAEGHIQHPSLKLKENTLATFKHEMTEIGVLFANARGGKKLTKPEMDGIRFNTLDLSGEHRAGIVEYGCDDAVQELKHHYLRYERVKDSLIYQIEMAIQPIACQMMDEGLLLDWPRMREGAVKAGLFQGEMLAEIQDDLSAMLQAKGIDELCTVNLNSWQQLGRVLYEQLEMPVHRRSPRRKNKKGEMVGGTPSTNSDTALMPLSKQYPVVQRIIDYRSLGKLKSTYLEPYEEKYGYCPCGRTHPNWMQAGVPAGRWACSAWQVQAAPKTYRYVLHTGKEFRHNFRDNVRAPEGWYFLGYDYAQIERRVFAGEAQDPALLEAFRSGVDIHKRTAADLFGIPIDQVTKDQRAVGKTTGFGMDYGLGDDGMADRLGISLEEAAGLRAAYFSAYSCLQPWTARSVAQAKRDGFVLTGGFKRKVTIWEFQSTDRRTYSEGERLAGNAPIQGGAADYMKVAMIRADAALNRAGMKDRVRLVMNMHDMLGWYVREDVAPLTVIRELQQAVVWTAPFISHWPPMVAEWSLGLRWGTMEEIELDLDSSGYPLDMQIKGGAKPVPQGSGDEAIPLDVDKAAVRVVVQDVAGGVQPAVAAERPRGSARGGGDHAGSVLLAPDFPGSGDPVLIVVTEMPLPQRVRMLAQSLRMRPGDSQIILRTPQGDVPLAEGCALVPAQAPEVSLALDLPATVTYALPQPV